MDGTPGTAEETSSAVSHGESREFNAKREAKGHQLEFHFTDLFIRKTF